MMIRGIETIFHTLRIELTKFQMMRNPLPEQHLPPKQHPPPEQHPPQEQTKSKKTGKFPTPLGLS